MTEQPNDGVKRLWTKDGFADDPWTRVETFEEAGSNSRAILPLDIYLALDPETREREKDRLAVELKPADRLESIVPFLPLLRLVALAFPAFNDGRSYSKAQPLRARHGFAGAIRATGDVLIDQIPLMLRTGFTEFEVVNPTALKRLEAGRLGGIPIHYQPSAIPQEAAGRYSWRRKPAA